MTLYAVSAAVSLITGFERDRRGRGLERERELHRQRIEISQTIHDTTAQWAYMIGLGVEGAMELVEESNDALMAKLRLTADLSRSAMWELRHPIDGGQIFRGEELGEVLEAHAATFTVITSIPAELVQQGRETADVDDYQELALLNSSQRPDQCDAARRGQPGRHQSRLR